MARCKSCSLRAPKNLATTTFVPIESPRKRFTRRLIKEPVEPTAARELSPAKRPTTTTSAALKSSCKRLEKIRGIEKASSLEKTGPSVISILFFVFIPGITVYPAYL